MKRWTVLLGFALGIVLCGPVAADQKDPRLAPLFERLKETPNPVEAQAVEIMIWQIWAESGKPAVDSLMLLGVQAMQGGDLAGAFSLFDAITAQAPDFAEGWNKRATVLYMIGQYDASAADVEKTLALEPRHFGALSGLGLINMALERPDAALKAFEKALAVHPNLPGVKANIETLKQKDRKEKRAI